MKYFKKFIWFTGFLAIALSAAAQPGRGQRSFTSPDEAVKVLQAATQAKDKAALNEIFGPKVEELLTGDETQDAKNAQRFANSIAQSCTLMKEGEDKIIFEVGDKNWPMPIPLVKAQGQWYFDTAAGKDEIINRHIGKDELHAIGVCRAYVAAPQHEKLDLGTQPFHGYYFKILPRHGHAASGVFALVAYPAYWGHSGIMTFIVNQDGKVFQRDLGEKSLRIASVIKKYNPDRRWTLVQEKGIWNIYR